MRSFEVLFEEEAFRELQEATAWYERRNPDVAAKFEEAVHRARQLIAEGPDRWPRVDNHLRQIRVRGFSYFLIYRPDTVPVRIVAVAHTGRKRGYWRGRSSDT